MHLYMNNLIDVRNYYAGEYISRNFISTRFLTEKKVILFFFFFFISKLKVYLNAHFLNLKYTLNYLNLHG